MNTTLILKAAFFAAQKHRVQTRKGEGSLPYINHPLQVALILSETGGINDPEVIAAALLHDTIEDTDTMPEELENEFGPRVRSLVEELTDDKSLPRQRRKQLQVEHAADKSPEAAAIKIADKISNIMDVTQSPPEGWDIARRREYLEWGERVVKNLPTGNKALERLFKEVLAEGKKKIH
jgi:guanosine-3',5'-bis(diphosphate) 3'-pyrophosphohydrolase